MTISEQLTALADIKADIKQAIIDKGGTVSDSDAFSTYADKISNLPGGSDWKVIKEIPNVDVLDGSPYFAEEVVYSDIELILASGKDAIIRLSNAHIDSDYYENVDCRLVYNDGGLPECLFFGYINNYVVAVSVVDSGATVATYSI